MVVSAELVSCQTHLYVWYAAAAPASKVEVVVRSPANMAAAKIAAVDFNKMTSKRRYSTGLLAAMFVEENLLANW